MRASCQGVAAPSTPSSAWSALAVAGAACLFGLTGTIAALGPDTVTPTAAGAWRSLIGAVALVAFSAIRSQPIWSHSLGSRWVWLGGLGVAGYQLTFFEAVDRTGVALGTLTAIGTGPPVAGLLDLAVNGRRPNLRWVLGSAVAIGGVATLTLRSAEVDATGVMFAVLAGCSFPLYGLAGQKLMGDRPVATAMASVFAAGAVLTLPLAVATTDVVFASVASTATVTALGVATLAVAYILWGYGLRSLRLGVVITLTLVEPGVAALLAVVVLDESWSWMLALGLTLISGGVALSATERA